jgi:hypothetical protein
MFEIRQMVLVVSGILVIVTFVVAKAVRVRAGYGFGPIIFSNVVNEFSTLGDIAGDLPRGQRLLVQAIRWTLLGSFLVFVVALVSRFFVH